MELIKTTHVFTQEDLVSQEAVMRFLAAKSGELGFADDPQEIYEKLLERENEGTTGMMDGFAIPHAKSAAIASPEIVIVKLAQAVDWNSLDEKPTDFVIALFIPGSEAGTAHLKLLSMVARLLLRPEVTEQLKSAEDAEAIVKLLNQKLEIN